MKFLKFSIASFFISLFFIACEKDNDIAGNDQPNDPPSVSTQPVEGTWMGMRYGHTKSIPFEFGFNVKPNGVLDVLDTKKDVAGSGTWSFDNNIFKAVFTTSKGEKYSVKSDIHIIADKIGGTWGHDNHETDGGFWNMKRQD